MEPRFREVRWLGRELKNLGYDTLFLEFKAVDFRVLHLEF